MYESHNNSNFTTGLSVSHFHILFLYYLQIPGGFDSLLKARKHYASSLNLQCARLNLRAVYGLISSAKGLEAMAVAVSGQVSGGSAVAVIGEGGR